MKAIIQDAWTREHVLGVTELIEAGQFMPVIDRTVPLADTAVGLRHVAAEHAGGKVVVTVA
jgi:NADPH:quinone reductase-like Zn-dependent oxidoreductase